MMTMMNVITYSGKDNDKNVTITMMNVIVGYHNTHSWYEYLRLWQSHSNVNEQPCTILASSAGTKNINIERAWYMVIQMFWKLLRLSRSAREQYECTTFILLTTSRPHGMETLSELLSLRVGNPPVTLQWRHNGHDSVWNHQPHECLLNRLLRRRSKKTSKLRITGLSPVNSPHKAPVTQKMFSLDDVIMTGGFPTQRVMSVNVV